ncbi:MAG: TlyA family RNA methyltransferase [Clostridia bacterium]|nr:TlyA family RNA methyltransferase [Clostridia bacterium]
MRIDLYLFEKGFVNSRTRAVNLIKLGGVKVNGKKIEKPSLDVDDADEIEVNDVISYASLGGLKLAYALEEFTVDSLGVCVDLGASNGGFTDVLLRAGAEKVYAVDIGVCALPKEMQKDERVVVVDKTNARDTGLPAELADTVTADLSFISLSLVIPEVKRLLKKGGKAILLVKPQFEVGRAGLTKSGIVKDEKTARKAVDRISAFAKDSGFAVLGLTSIRKLFENKNIEYLLYLGKN